LAVGLSPSEPANERALSTSSKQGQSVPAEQASTASAEQLSRLEQALRDERTRADNAERLAASYLANVEDLRRAMRMLEAGTSKPEQVSELAQSVVSEHATGQPETLTKSAVSNPEHTPDIARDGPRPVPIWRRLLIRR
jgi:hypothetical protein